MHRLSGVGVDGDHVLVTLDETQVLTLDAADSTVDGRVLYVTIRGGRWDWTEYGGDHEHSEALGPGHVELHAFIRS
jgi:hypothetical protein